MVMVAREIAVNAQGVVASDGGVVPGGLQPINRQGPARLFQVLFAPTPLCTGCRSAPAYVGVRHISTNTSRPSIDHLSSWELQAFPLFAAVTAPVIKFDRSRNCSSHPWGTQTHRIGILEAIQASCSSCGSATATEQ